MKMTKAQKMRLTALLAQDQAKLSYAETTELKALTDLADGEGFDAKFYDADSDTDTLTDEQVEAIVTKALTKTLSDNGLSTDAIVAKVKALKGGDLTAERIEQIIKANATKEVDTKALIDNIKAALPAGVSEEKMKAMFKEAFDAQRKDSKMEHSVIEFPIAHRSGNLSVAQKQLLNVCLMHSTNDDVTKPKNMNDGISTEQLAKATRNGEFAVKSMRESFRRGTKITVGGSGSGAELIDTDLSSDLQRRLYQDSALATALISSEIQMPTNPFKLPMLTTRPSFFVTGETQAAIESDAGTAAPTLDAKKLTGMVPYSYEADEDAIIAILPMIQEGLAAGAADAFEGALINGDVTGTHQDSDIAAVTRHSSKLFKGLRKMVRGVTGLWSDLSTGGVSAANIGALRKLLKKYGLRPSDLALVCGTGAYNDIVLLEETLTVDKVGNRAGILTGIQPNIFGIEIIPSAACRENLTGAGIYDGVTMTKGAIFLMHKPSFLVGVKRGFTVEVEQDKKAQVNYVIASFRRDFIAKETPSATEPLIVAGYNF